MYYVDNRMRMYSAGRRKRNVSSTYGMISIRHYGQYNSENGNSFHENLCSKICFVHSILYSFVTLIFQYLPLKHTFVKTIYMHIYVYRLSIFERQPQLRDLNIKFLKNIFLWKLTGHFDFLNQIDISQIISIQIIVVW